MNAMKMAVTAVLLATGAAQAAGPSGPKFVCWTDEKGVRSCGDHVPPQYVKGEREQIDSQGRVVDTLAREKTPEERAAEEAAKKLAEEEAFRKRQQAEYDKFLMDTYSNESELTKARDERITTLEGRMKLVDSAIASGEVSLKQLRDRQALAEKAAANKPPADAAAAPPPPPVAVPEPPPPPPPASTPASGAKGKGKTPPKPKPKPVKPRTLPEQIADWEKSLAENQAAAKSLAAEREATRTKFDADIARWRMLKGMPPAEPAKPAG